MGIGSRVIQEFLFDLSAVNKKRWKRRITIMIINDDSVILFTDVILP